MAKKHLFLPKLSDANVAEPKQNGHWEHQEKSIIRSISDGIEVERDAHTRGVSSVPDAYGRPLTFQSALSSEPEKPHPVRPRVVQEWRGLLSLLALYRVKPDLNKITFTPVQVRGGDERRLPTSLFKLRPRPVELQPGIEYVWTEFLLVQFEGVTLGAFSPSTLVYTSADYHLKLRKKDSFALKDAEGYLCPPPASNTEDLLAVGEWVQWLAGEFAKMTQGLSESSSSYPIVGMLNRELRTWLLEIRRALGLPNYEALDSPVYEPAAEPERVSKQDFLERRPIYQLLLRPLKDDKNAATGPMSQYALEIDPSRRPVDLDHVVLIDASLLGQDRILWKGLRSSELGPDPIRSVFREASGTRINNVDIGKDRGLWIRPELYFLTPTLTRAAGPGNFLPGAEARANGNTARYLLPLRKEILRFFTVEDITDKLQPTFTEESDRVVFTLRLPMARGQSLLVKKSYLNRGAVQAAGEGALIERPVPVLELFPNYMGEFWGRYYMLFSDTEKLAAEPVHYGTEHFYLTQREQRLDSAAERLRAELTRISGPNCFPEGIALTERGSQAPIGLVLVEKDHEVEKRSFQGKAIVGVDFGTSNTNVFTLRDDDDDVAEPLELRFRTDYLRSLLAAEPEARKVFAQAFFVPVEDIRLPTPTALREYNPGVRKELLLDYFLYFPDRPRYPENVLVDLKWEEETTSNLNNYLEGLVFLILVELVRQRVGTIEFRCTYPKSFNKTREQDYRSKWNSTLEGLFEKEGKPDELRTGQKILFGPIENWDDSTETTSLVTRAGKFTIGKVPKFVTEGIAAGEFFSSKQASGIKDDDLANKYGGSICIDVGGGTTDYSIWFKSEIKYDASVLLAGRQIAEVMARNSRIGDHLLSADANAALREAKAGGRFASRMNYILRREHKEISANLAKVSNLRDVANLRRVLVVEFGALAFYAGHLTLALDQFLKGDLGRSLSEGGLSLYWGGNASKMLDWIDHGKFKRDGLAAAFLNNLFASVVMGEIAPENERIILDPVHLHQKKQEKGQKNEAAGGVVVIKNIDRIGITGGGAEPKKAGFIIPGKREVKNVLEGTVMGESITLGSQNTTPYQPVTNEELFQGYTSLFEGSTQSQLDYFLEALNAIGESNGFLPAGEQITLSPQERMAIRNNLRNDFARLASQEPSQRIVEPAFIMEVRYLLNLMLEKML